LKRTARKPLVSGWGNAPRQETGVSCARVGASAPSALLALSRSLIALTVIVGVMTGFTPVQAVAQTSSVIDPEAAPKAPTFDTPAGGNILPDPEIDRNAPLYLQGDELIYDNSGNTVTARGNVEIFYNDYILTADEVVYDQGANTLTAVGNTVLKEPNGNIIRADRYTLTDDFRDGFVQSLSIVAKDDTRIVAARASRRDGNVNEFEQAKFTPCKSEGGMPPLWCLSAARIVHDQEAATITYQDAQFEFLGTPILYLPYFQHADPSVKRKSGFLKPGFGNSDDLGFFTETPYYFALSPHYDFTFRPRYMTRQGVLWQGDWRHRLANGQYIINLAGIDQDADDLPNNAGPDGFRGSLETRGLFSLSSWWQFGWDATFETDDTFRRFYKLDSILLTDRVNRAFIVGQSDRNYFSANFYQVEGLERADSPQAESRVHPVIDYNYIVKDPIAGGELRVDTNVLSFSRGNFAEDGTSQQDLNRVTTEVSWRRRLIDQIGITYTPFANLRGDLYQYGNYVDPTSQQADDNETVARGVAAGGVTVAYPWVASTAQATHTIEPIGQIIARTGSVRQDDLPNEDAQSLVFDDTNLFEIDKFSGYDRIETGTRANVGVQYTFQTDWGGHAQILLGQSFHLAGENAFLDPGTTPDGRTAFTAQNGLETTESDYVVGAYLSPASTFRLIGQGRFDQESLDVRRVDATGLFNYGPLLLTGTYSYSAIEPELTEEDSITASEIVANARLQLTSNWSIGGSIRYDIDQDFTLSDSIMLRYADDCFVLTAQYTEKHYRDETRDIEPDRTGYMVLSFKHLGDFEYKTNALDYIFGDQQPPLLGNTNDG